MSPSVTPDASTAGRARLLGDRHPVAATLLIAAAYAVTAALGMQLGAHTSVTPVFYSAGIALGAVIAMGPRALAGVALGSFVGNAFLFPATAGGARFPLAAFIAAGAVAQAQVGALLAARQAEDGDPFRSPRSVLGFVLVAALPSCVVSASVGVGALGATGFLAASPATAWLTWWVGDAAGVLTAVPFLLARSEGDLPGTRREAWWLGALTLVAGVAVAASGSPLVYLLMPSVVWAALRFGVSGVARASMAVSLFAIAAALGRGGDFRHFGLSDTLLLLQLLIGVSSTMGLVIAALAQGERRAESARRAANDALSSRARELTSLHAELSHRVADRATELSSALSRLSGGFRASPARLMEGDVLAGRLRIERFLAQGGMGAVYRAFDNVLGRDVAVKVAHATSAEHLGDLFRFFTEARAASAVSSPAVVKTLAVDVTEDGLVFQILELVEGEALSSRLERLPRLSPGEVARVGSVLASALGAAHDAGVVHRDVKPSNVMLTPAEPGVKLLDFGVSRLEGDEARPWKTRTGFYVGTPAYMAPEQLGDASRAGPPSDIYALGVTLFELLRQRRPGADENLVAQGERGGPGERELTLLVATLLQRDPARRPSASVVAEGLRRFADREGAPSAAALAALAPPTARGAAALDVHAVRPVQPPTVRDEP